MTENGVDRGMCPEVKRGGCGLKVVRVKAQMMYRGFCVSDALVLAATHFFRGRTVPCLVRNCPACVRGRPRVYAYVGWQYSGGVGVLELPERSAVEGLSKLSGSAPLLGRSLIAHRVSGPRSAVVAEFGSVVEGVTMRRVSRQEVRGALCRMWGVAELVANGSDDVESLEGWREQVRLVLLDDEHFARRGKGVRHG